MFLFYKMRRLAAIIHEASGEIVASDLSAEQRTGKNSGFLLEILCIDSYYRIKTAFRYCSFLER